MALKQFSHFVSNNRLYRIFACIFILLLTKQLLFVYKLDVTLNKTTHHKSDLMKSNLSDTDDGLSDRMYEILSEIYNTTDEIDIKYISSIFADRRVPSSEDETVSDPMHNQSVLRRTDENIKKFFHINEKSQKDPLLNLHKYQFSLGSDVCKVMSPDIVIFVHSATFNKDRRMLIRKTWGKYHTIQNLTLSTLFMIGQADKDSTQKDLLVESENYGDIVQGNFVDSYKNLTYKHIMGYHWILTNCLTAKLFVKVDDDVLVNVFNIVEYISEKGFHSSLLYCNILHHGVAMRGKRNKWSVGEDLYPFDNYPNYCAGMAYLISPDVARKLYKASGSTRFYWVDDVYVTGMLTLKVGQKLTPMEEGHLSTYMKGYHRATVQHYMFLVGSHFYEVLWKALMRYREDRLVENMVSQ